MNSPFAPPIFDIESEVVGFPPDDYEYSAIKIREQKRLEKIEKRKAKAAGRVPARGRRMMMVDAAEEDGEIYVAPPPRVVGEVKKFETEADFWEEITRLTGVRGHVIIRGDLATFGDFYKKMYEDLYCAMLRGGYSFPDHSDSIALFSYIISLGRETYETVKNDVEFMETLAATQDYVSFDSRLPLFIRLK